MKTITIFLTLILTTHVMAIETLDYELIKKDNSIELRKYDTYITASVTFDSKKEFDEKAFRTLADYIFGNNISMTAPVLTKGERIGMTSPVLSESDRTSWTMSFTMPKKYTMETLPTPTNPKVRIEEVEQKVMAAIRFNGFMSDSNYKRHETKLNKWLSQNDYDAISGVIRAGYNPPWTLPFFRRNEVLIQVK